MSKRISIILVGPEYAGNIGSAARAMKNMGLKDLRLVRPPADWFDKGKIMAVFAADLLKRAKIFDSLEDALKDMRLVVGTTRRVGSHRGSFLSFPDAVKKIRMAAQKKKVGIVFGKESKGLSNQDLALCDWMVQIPSDKAYPSINLAQAVMLMSFSIFMAGEKQGGEVSEFDFLSKRDVGAALDRFDEAVQSLAYKPVVAKRIHATFHNLIKRSGLLKSEAQMIKGLSRRIFERFPERLKVEKSRRVD